MSEDKTEVVETQAADAVRESCSGDGDCDCVQTTLSTVACDMCSSAQATYRENVTFWRAGNG